MSSQVDFSFETTLSSRSFIRTIERAKSKGYYVTLIFFWLESIELAKDRVINRVKEGGHHISADVIERRYKAGINNLFKIYQNKVDSLLIYDNSNSESELIAEKEFNGDFSILNWSKFENLKYYYNE